MTNLQVPRVSNDSVDIDDLRRECAIYREHLQRTIVVDVASMQIVMTAGDNLDAITMPAALGQRVLPVLAHEKTSGPTIAGPGPSRWTILTEPNNRARPTCSASVHRAGVTLVPRGSQIILPSSGNTVGTYMWIDAPRALLRLPEWSRVMSAVSRIAVEGGGERAS